MDSFGSRACYTYLLTTFLCLISQFTIIEAKRRKLASTIPCDCSRQCEYKLQQAGIDVKEERKIYETYTGREMRLIIFGHLNAGKFRDKNGQLRFKYRVWNIEMCKRTFASLLGVSLKKVDRVQACLRESKSSFILWLLVGQINPHSIFYYILGMEHGNKYRKYLDPKFKQVELWYLEYANKYAIQLWYSYCFQLK